MIHLDFVGEKSEIGVITIDRSDVRNAIDKETVTAFHKALGAIEKREDVRALIVTGAGGKAFAAGADIAELRDRRRADALEGINGALFQRVEKFPRPTVAAIVGYAHGGGCELALACDFRIAGESSKFGQPEVGLGIMAGAGATRRLPALVGLKAARRLLFSGEIVDARKALEIGLADRVVPDADVMKASIGWLEPILVNSAEALRWTKKSLVAWSHGADEETLARMDREAQAVLFEHLEKFARMDAFLAKRAKPS